MCMHHYFFSSLAPIACTMHMICKYDQTFVFNLQFEGKKNFEIIFILFHIFMILYIHYTMWLFVLNFLSLYTYSNSEIVYPEFNKISESGKVERFESNNSSFKGDGDLYKLTIKTLDFEVNLTLKNVDVPFHKNVFIRRQILKNENETEIQLKDELDNLLFQDVDGASVILVQLRKNQNVFHGFIQGFWRIWPISSSSHDSEKGETPHIFEEVKREKISDTHFTTDFGTLSYKQIRSTVPENLDVETLVLVTSEYQGQFQTIPDIAKYLAVFVQFVNLRYTAVKKPKISLTLVGVMLDGDDMLSQFFQKFLIEGYDRDAGMDGVALDDVPLLLNVAKLLMDKIDVEFDVCLILSSWNLAFSSQALDPTITLLHRISGLALIGGACSPGKNIAIIKDFGATFDGCFNAVHQIGHLLGSDHDSIQESPLARRCFPPDLKHIMTFNFLVRGPGPTKFELSQCSIDQFRYFSKLDLASCFLEEGNSKQQRVGDGATDIKK